VTSASEQAVADVERSDEEYVLTRDGQPAAVLVGYDRWQRLCAELESDRG
jgi:prevent-host-death family protein